MCDIVRTIPGVLGERMLGGGDNSYDFFPSMLGKDTFLNLLVLDKSHGTSVKTYTFYRYEISQCSILHFWYMSEKPVIKAINAGKLKGIISGGKPKTALIQDSSENIQAFILRSNPHRLFKEDGGVLYKK